MVGQESAGLGDEPPAAEDVRISPNGTQALALVTGQLYLAGRPGHWRRGAYREPRHALGSAEEADRRGGGQLQLGRWGQDHHVVAGCILLPAGHSVGCVRHACGTEGRRNSRRTGGSGRAADKTPKYEEISVSIEAPRSTPKGVVVLQGAKIITMHGDEVIPDGEIVITDNRITSVGKNVAPRSLPAGAKIIDVKGATIMPGIVDVHAHWTEIRRNVLDLESWPFLANLAYGVTTGRDPQTSRPDTFAYQDLIDMGEMPGPRAFSTGPGIFSNTDFQSAGRSAQRRVRATRSTTAPTP